MKIAYCSCNHALVHRSQSGWLQLAAQQPDVLLLLGDNVYVERSVAELVGGQRPCMRLGDLDYGRRLHEMYEAQWAVPQFQLALAAVHSRKSQGAGWVFGTLDDHDFLGNDTFVTPWLQRKARLARLLHRQFIAACNTTPLPLRYPPFEAALEGSDDGFAQGLGLAHAWQGPPSHEVVVKIIILDNRSYRSRASGAGAACLGAAQISWLAQELLGAQQLTLVASGSTFSAGDKLGIEGSPLANYSQEAAVLRNLYRGHRVGSLIHLGGDLHYNAHWPAAPEHPFFELASSGMGSGWQPFSSRDLGNFGILAIERDALARRFLRMQLWGGESERNLDIFHLLEPL